MWLSVVGGSFETYPWRRDYEVLVALLQAYLLVKDLWKLVLEMELSRL